MEHHNGVVHDCVLNGIAKNREASVEKKPCWLAIVQDRNDRQETVNCASIEHLKRFLREWHSPPLTDLRLAHIRLCAKEEDDHHGGEGAAALNSLQELFVNDITALTSVMLLNCHFGGAQDAARFLTAFHSNTTITTLILVQTVNLVGTELGRCLAALLLNNKHLQRLDCSNCFEHQEEALTALLPGLENNRTLKELCLADWFLRDAGLSRLVDTLVGNTTLLVLEISINDITCKGGGLFHISRLLESAGSRLTKIDFSGNHGILDDEQCTCRFAQSLSKNEYLTTAIMDHTPSDPAAALIFHSLESNTTLEYLQLGPLPDQVIRDDGDDDDDDDYFIGNSPGLEQLIQSLPRMRGIKRLGVADWESYIYHPGFLPALGQNQTLQELVGLFDTDEASPTAPRRGHRRTPDQQATVMAIKKILARNMVAATKRTRRRLFVP